MASAQQTVYFIDDDAGTRRALSLLMKTVDLPYAGFGSTKEFFDAYEPSWQGCLVVDVRLPGMSGLEMVEQLTARAIPLPAILVTGHADVGMAVRALKAGAIDFLEKPYDPQTLLEDINRAFAVDADRREQRERRAAIMGRLKLLTPREREVLEGIVSGAATKAIAAQLGIRRKTLDVHRANMMKKMQAKTIAELVREVLLLGRNKVQDLVGALIESP